MGKYSKKSIKKMIKRILRSSHQGGGGSCQDQLRDMTNNYNSCKMNLSGTPILPPSLRFDQTCSNLCPITKADCISNFPITKSEYISKFPITKDECISKFSDVCKKP